MYISSKYILFEHIQLGGMYHLIDFCIEVETYGISSISFIPLKRFKFKFYFLGYLFLFKVYEYFFPWMYACASCCQCWWRPDEGIESSRTRAIHHWKLPHRFKTWALVFYDSNKCSFTSKSHVQTSVLFDCLFFFFWKFYMSTMVYIISAPPFPPLQLPHVLYSLNFIVFSSIVIIGTNT